MMDPTPLTLDWMPASRNGSGCGTLTARLGASVLAAEKLDLLRPRQREGFINRLTDGRPGIDAVAVAAELLRLAGQAAARPEPAITARPPELDVCDIARPELFHQPDVSGVAPPTLSPTPDGGVAGRWVLYLRWHADGRRERRELSASIDLPAGRRLWFHPIPADPEPTSGPGWSAAGRAAWLAGAPAPDPVKLIENICERIAYHVDFPADTGEGATALLTLWTLLTYGFPAWPGVPYLAIGGPQASGKTVLLRVLSRMVFRPVESSTMTAPCLYRTLHERGGTLLLDEAERLRDGTPDAGELRAVLLSGYKRGSPALRLEKVGDSFAPQAFDVYGPKALAAIQALPEALASRCLRIAMLRAPADSAKPRRRLDESPELWAALRDDLHALAMEHGRTWLDLAGRADTCPATFSGRDYELWQPIFALATWLESCGAGGLVGIVREYAERMTEGACDDSVPEGDEALLRLLAWRVAAGTHRDLTAGELLREACRAEPGTFGSEERPRWSPKAVARALSRYGVRTRKLRGRRVYADAELDTLRSVASVYGFALGAAADDEAPQPPDLFAADGGGARGVHRVRPGGGV